MFFKGITMINDMPISNDQYENDNKNFDLSEQDPLYRQFSYAENQDILEKFNSSEVIQDKEIKFTELKPDSIYEKNGYEYRTNQEGRVNFVYGELDFKEGGRTHHQTEVGKLGLETDEGGHLIGQRFNGPTDGFNMVPQDANLNKGAWKSMEDEWASSLKEGHKVTVAIEPINDKGNVRPLAFDVVWQIDKGLPHYRNFENRSYKV